MEDFEAEYGDYSVTMKIDDIRLFYENDVRFLKQFSASL